MKVLCSAFLVLAFALTTFAVPAEEDFKDTPYYPMQIGATWTYKSGDSHFTLKVTKHEKIGTTTCARVESMQDGKAVGSEDVFLREDGVCRLASGDKLVDPPVLILKLPPTKNDQSWGVDSKADTRAGAKESLKGTFTEHDGEEVTIADKKYTTVAVSCENLDANGAKYSFKTYYAKDVGMVKQEIEAGGLKVVIELEKYEPAPK